MYRLVYVFSMDYVMYGSSRVNPRSNDAEFRVTFVAYPIWHRLATPCCNVQHLLHDVASSLKTIKIVASCNMMLHRLAGSCNIC